ncbi:MAG: adenylosuccinate lyase [Flavobacteriaceae bacterium]
MSELEQQLQYTNAARFSRKKAAMWVLKHPETIEELLHFCFKNDKELSHKANWTLEFVCMEKLELLFPHLDYFFSHLGSVKEDSSVRPLSHICELLCHQYYKKGDKTLQQLFSETYKEILVEVCFDWLITNQKVACEVRAMSCLYELGTEKDWIHSELKTIIEQNIHTRSAGYQSRGKKILDKIAKGSFPKSF